ncbi:MAG: helix-turn-helix transcriptional regulator [Bacteroidetes bacterium]|nr:helix-turn-helix transcriptional regulator [Bacteroidota bacterium]
MNTALRLQHLAVSQQLLRALVNPLRYKMLQYIAQNKRVGVEQIYTDLKLNESICSQQLKILREQKIVLTERRGKQVIYSVNTNRLSVILAAVHSFFDKW